MNKVKHSHDSVFKKALSNKVITESFLRCHLDRNLQEYINFSSLTLMPGSFIGVNLKKSYVDVLYKLNLTNGNERFIYILIEHQSKQERFMSIRFEKYNAEIMLQHVNELGYDIPPIVYPIVVYNGKHKYKQPTDYYSFFDGTEYTKFIMRRPFHLIDLTQITDKELLQKGYHGVVLVILKYRKLRSFIDFFYKILPYLQKIDVIASSNTTAALINYMIEVHDVNDFATMDQLIKQQFQPETAEAYMTGAERLIQKGREQGIEQGMEKGRIQERIQLVNNLIAAGFDIELIANSTNIPLAQLKDLIQYH